MQNIRISIIQTHLHWENTDANLGHFSKKLDAITEATDVIVLPEMFTTGFSIHREHTAEEQGGKGLQWMLQKAKEKNCDITGSIAVKEGGNLFNRLYWVKANGSFQQYDKRHLFAMAGEDKHFTAGTKKIIVDVKGWKICPLICYDLRFPVWSRNAWKNKEAQYDVLLYVANWPEVRSYPWKQLLIARAIENQAYVIGVNRIGEDGNKFPHSGDSAVINPRGEILSKANANEDRIETLELSYDYLQEFRKLFPVGMDADAFTLD
ncbi:MAG: amidohydrolase [Bacteroidetes bacterium]|jgi:predicted amidohydrolase|nr:amidohydrolase [Bacteroidota bacterium]